MEAHWMAQVRYEFSVGLREEVFAAWIRFVKYKTIKRSSCANRYSLFLLELQKDVEKMRIKKAEIDANREAKRKMQCFDALVANISR